MKEHFFDYSSEDLTEEIPLVSNNRLVGIVLPEEQILKTPYSPRIKPAILSRVTHDPAREILVAIGQAPNSVMLCQYFRCREVKKVPLNFSAS